VVHFVRGDFVVFFFEIGHCHPPVCAWYQPFTPFVLHRAVAGAKRLQRMQGSATGSLLASDLEFNLQMAQFSA
jgi:hypothetical protein